MSNFWGRATWLLDILVRRLLKHDDNGMELRFTCGKDSLNLDPKKSQKPDLFKAKMDKARPVPGSTAKTDMKANLSVILDKHIRDHPTLQRKLLVIVLTDGIWEGMSSELEVDNYLVDVILKLNEILDSTAAPVTAKDQRASTSTTTLEDRPISISFIGFGHDQKAIIRLDRLDNQLQDRPELVGKSIRYATQTEYELHNVKSTLLT